MAYAQWVTITIQPANYDVTIKHVSQSWGKFYDSNQVGKPGGNKDNEYPASDLENKVIERGRSFSINACGRSDASSGTEGSIEIYDGEKLVGTYSWDCPWGSKTNTSTWTPGCAANGYITEQSGANLNSGALGTVTIRTVKFG